MIEEPKFDFEVWMTDKHGEFLRHVERNLTERQAFIAARGWADATHFRLRDRNCLVWKEWKQGAGIL